MLLKKSFALAGHRTSVALEAPFWAVLEGAAAAHAQSLTAFVATVDAARDPRESLASTLRILALHTASAKNSESR